LERNSRKVRVGKVVSDKMDKTVVVAVKRTTKHPLFGKTMVRTKKYKAHDADDQCRTGDKVKIMETKPLSKDKRWRLTEIMERSQL